MQITSSPFLSLENKKERLDKRKTNKKKQNLEKFKETSKEFDQNSIWYKAVFTAQENEAFHERLIL